MAASPANARIWIDVDNPPQVQYLYPFVEAFRDRGAEVILTARDYGNALELLRLRGASFYPVGEESGVSKVATSAHCSSWGRIPHSSSVKEGTSSRGGALIAGVRVATRSTIPHSVRSRRRASWSHTSPFPDYRPRATLHLDTWLRMGNHQSMRIVWAGPHTSAASRLDYLSRSRAPAFVARFCE